MEKNQLSTVKLNQMQQYQVDVVNEVEKGLQEVGQTFTDYGKQCVINAMAAIIINCKNNKIKPGDIDQTMLKIALTNVGLTELNFNAIPAEAFIDLRKAGGRKDDKGEYHENYSIAIRPQGAGNEKLVRRFGVNVKDLKSPLLIREGDEYELPGFDGEKMTPFTWKPKSLDKKVIMVVYPLLKKDGTYEYLMATRDSIIPNLIAQIRQNNLYSEKFKKTNSKGYEYIDTSLRDEFYEKLNKSFEGKTLDEILADPEWKDELSNTYTSGGSKEAMILRKMKNNALKYYPREYNSAAVAEAVKDMFEDKDDSLNEKPKNFVDVDAVQKVEQQLDEDSKEDAIQDFDVEEMDDKAIPVPENSPFPANEPESMPVNNRAPQKQVAKDTYEEDF